MYPSKRFLLIAIGLTAISAIVLESLAPLWAYGVAKGLTTVLVILLASRSKQISRLGAQVVTALFFCLLGDIALLWDELFLVGLAFFLVAHLLLIRGLTARFGFKFKAVGILISLSMAGVVISYMWPNVDAFLRIPIIAYVMVIGTMSSLALSIALKKRSKIRTQIGLGGLLFMVSDALLGINGFVNPIPLSGLLILGTYYGAISLLANAAREF
ncbi:MAG: lysoplasmalogenase [Bacteroidetes bacterium]|nr:lysoplasmalogenase [Bacteroidota bacterium]